LVKTNREISLNTHKEWGGYNEFNR
jgi:hypothetical protein